VLFRPEEVHCRSGIGYIFKPFAKRNRDVPRQLLRLRVEDFTIPHCYFDLSSAIQTRGIDLNDFAREQPADRQRFEPSLSEPFLLTIDRNAILGREIVKRRKGNDKVRVGKEPSGDACPKKRMQSLAAFLDGYIQLGRNFGIVRCLTGFDHTFHYQVKEQI
jgi:hypothetical protein